MDAAARSVMRTAPLGAWWAVHNLQRDGRCAVQAAPLGA